MRLRSVPAPWLARLGSTPLAGAKTLSYAHNMAARRLAQEEGYDDALLLDSDGTVLEGPTWTVLWVEGGRVYTPPLALGILDSITRRTIMRLVSVEECAAPLARVLDADEVLCASTAREAGCASCIDDREWRDAPGPVTGHIGALFRAEIERSLGPA